MHSREQSKDAGGGPQAPSPSYTFEGIIEFLSNHKSTMQVCQEELKQDNDRFSTRIISLEQEVGGLKLTKFQLDKRLLNLELYFKAKLNSQKNNQLALNEVQQNHHRVKSDQIRNLGYGPSEESLSLLQRQNLTKGTKVESNFENEQTQKTLILQFLKGLEGSENDKERNDAKQQFKNNFSKFDSIIQQRQQTSQIKNSSNVRTSQSDPFAQSQQQKLISKQRKPSEQQSQQPTKIVMMQGTGHPNSAPFSNTINNQASQSPVINNNLFLAFPTLKNQKRSSSNSSSFILNCSQLQDTSSLLSSSHQQPPSKHVKQKSSLTSQLIMQPLPSNSAIPPNDKQKIFNSPIVSSVVLSQNDFLSNNQSHSRNKICAPLCTLFSHLDGVRALFFTAQDSILLTAGEDCMLKLWDIRKFNSESEITIQPYLSLRSHKRPIFCITGTQQQENSLINYEGYNFSFTAGAEGIIKVWNIPNSESTDSLGVSDKFGGCSVSVGSWQAHYESIWDINHHPQQPLMLSAGADGLIRLWRTFLPVDSTSLVSLQQGELAWQLQHKPGAFPDIPTSLAWDLNRRAFLSGWVHSNHLASFNYETGQLIGIAKFQSQGALKGQDNYSAQINKVVCNEGFNCAITAHEDNKIRFFDLNSSNQNKKKIVIYFYQTDQLVKSMIGHTDSVTSISVLPKSNYLISVGHDGCMRTWDIRKYQCVYDIQVHKKKYDEAVHSVINHPNLPLIATENKILLKGGADGITKIFQQQQAH